VLGETPEKYSFSGVLLYLGHWIGPTKR